MVMSMEINNQDERYLVVEDAICDSFLLLLREKSLDKISVSDIIKKAGIVRSTFYNHYENVPNLVTAMEDRTINDIFNIMESFHPKNDYEICHTYFMAICQYTKKNPFLAELLRSPRGDAFFEKALTMFHRYVTGVMDHYNPSTQNKEEFSFVIASAIGSVIGVLHKWSRDDFRTDTEIIVDVLTKTFISGALPLMS